MFLATLLVFAIASSCSAESLQSDITLVLYYEGLCPDCHEFILEQLYPGYLKLGNYFKVDLVPYGNTHYTKDENGTITFRCQHGNQECLLNRIHACALDQNPTQLDTVSFVNCDLSGAIGTHTDEELLATAQECAENNNISFDQIKSCVFSTLSDELLLKYANRQEQQLPRITYVPNIRFNGLWNKTLEDNAEKNLVGTICSLLDANIDECNDVVKEISPN